MQGLIDLKRAEFEGILLCASAHFPSSAHILNESIDVTFHAIKAGKNGLRKSIPQKLL